MSLKSRFFLVALCLMVGGCGIPLSRKQVNFDLFKGEKDFLAKTEFLSEAKGLAKSAILEHIDIPENRLQKELPLVTQELLFPNTVFQPRETGLLVDFHNLINKYTTYSFRFSNLDKDADLMLHRFHVRVNSDGFDHRVFLIFRDGECGGPCLDNAFLAIVPIHERDKVYLWDFIGSAVSGAANQGGKEAMKETTKSLGF